MNRGSEPHICYGSHRQYEARSIRLFYVAANVRRTRGVVTCTTASMLIYFTSKVNCQIFPHRLLVGAETFTVQVPVLFTRFCQMPKEYPTTGMGIGLPDIFFPEMDR